MWTLTTLYEISAHVIMISLKAFAPVLAEALGTTPAAIYERQRALVRQGLLPAPVGRGRGHGLPASATTVAIIIIAMMVTDNLSDTDDRVRMVAEAQFFNNKHWGRHTPKPRCALTGRRDFKSALIALLRMTELPPGLTVSVSRKDLSAAITWGINIRKHRTQFGEYHPMVGLFVDATLPEGALQSIGASLRQANKEDPNPESEDSDIAGEVF
jgi:hypothetical protein